MKKTLKSTIIITLVTGLFVSLIGNISAVDPTYDTIILDPTEPIRKSSIDFSVDITGENIEEVYIRVQECFIEEDGTEACNPFVLNESLTTTDNVTWTGTATLTWVETTIGHCWLVIKSNGTWFDFDEADKNIYWTDFDVKVSENGDNGDNGNGQNGGNGGNGGNNTPGFELIVLIISTIVALALYKRKIMK